MIIDEAREARDLLAPLRERPLPVDEPGVTRERVLPALRAAIRTLPVRRAEARRRRVSWVALSAAAAVALVVGGVTLRGWVSGSESLGAASSEVEVVVEAGTVVHRNDGTSAAINEGEVARVAARGALTTGVSGRARVSVGGLELAVADAADIGLDELVSGGEGRRLRLHAGSVRCVVPPLGTGRFSVVTPDATVVVHGTVFTVAVSRDMGSPVRSCVAVEDGVVSVRHSQGEVRLTAGQRWGCGAPRPPAAATELTQARPPPMRTMPSAARAVGTLEEENRLFQRALTAERGGDKRGARAALGELLRRFPASPLAPEARVMLARLNEE